MNQVTVTVSIMAGKSSDSYDSDGGRFGENHGITSPDPSLLWTFQAYLSLLFKCLGKRDLV